MGERVHLRSARSSQRHGPVHDFTPPVLPQRLQHPHATPSTPPSMARLGGALVLALALLVGHVPTPGRPAPVTRPNAWIADADFRNVSRRGAS